MKTIQISDEMYNDLMDLAKEYSAQNTRCTGYPLLFQVETNVKQPRPFGCGDDTYWVDSSGELIGDLREALAYILDNSDDDEIATYKEDYNLDNEDSIESLLIDYGYDEISYSNEPEYKNAFFTAKGCQKHIDCNDYHYSNPKTYCIPAWRNPEMELISDLLLYLAKSEENPPCLKSGQNVK